MKKIHVFMVACLLAIIVSGCGTGTKPCQTEKPAEKKILVPGGKRITRPAKTKSVVSLSPAVTETLIDLKCADNITAIDVQSCAVKGAPEGLPAFDMMKPDVEQLIKLRPDVIFVSSLTQPFEEGAFKTLEKSGTTVVAIPTADSIAEIGAQTEFLGDIMGKKTAGKALTEKMMARIKDISQRGKTVQKKKKVYFEIAAAPDMYSFGKGTFLNEMITIVGAENIFADQKGWLPVSGESILSANPDVILTSVDYIPEPREEILSRPGFQEVKAVKTGQVYTIDNMAASLPDCHIVTALEEMVEAVYPDLKEK